MTSAKIRRSQLVAPFGVGAMMMAPNGVSMIGATLDQWYAYPDGSDGKVDLEEFQIHEWRLQKALKVSEFRLPPDFRTFASNDGESKNIRMRIPFLRFPSWHFCPGCKRLGREELHHSKKAECIRLSSDPKSPRRRQLVQMQFVAMCEHGHIQDFPYAEWVHRSTSTNCKGFLSIRATGGASLSSQVISCSCGEKRSLAGIMTAFTTKEGIEDTALSSTLDPGDRYLCSGVRPWQGDKQGQGLGCGSPIRGSLRAASNVYFARIESAIYLPGSAGGIADGLLEKLENLPLSTTIHVMRSLKISINYESLKETPHFHILKGFSRDEIDRALQELEEANKGTANIMPVEDDEIDPETIRRPEYEILRKVSDSDYLKIRAQNVMEYGSKIDSFFQKVNLVDQLRETRVFCGFSRVKPKGGSTLTQRKSMLWKKEPEFSESWLPAYVVNGEGIFFEFNEEKLKAWESRADVKSRVRALASNSDRVRLHRGLSDVGLIPRYVLVHTFAHLMINQLVFDCGYSSAALRERLFLSIGENPMAGVLIYTAAGDSEGTMGGLVRTGEVGNLEPSLIAALDRAKWCSSDPVCMELGEHGQGPGSMNLAACHSCGLLPETACEVFNQFLDRGLVTGTHENPEIGFFTI